MKNITSIERSKKQHIPPVRALYTHRIRLATHDTFLFFFFFFLKELSFRYAYVCTLFARHYIPIFSRIPIYFPKLFDYAIEIERVIVPDIAKLIENKREIHTTLLIEVASIKWTTDLNNKQSVAAIRVSSLFGILDQLSYSDRLE